MEMIYGALGAFFLLMVFLLGGALGWELRGSFPRATTEGPDADDLRRMQEAQNAFLQMQNYNADVAYGIGLHREDGESG